MPKIKSLGQKTKEDLLLLLLLTVSAAVIFYPFLTGQAFLLYLDVGGDTITQYYPLYRQLAADLRDGSFCLYNFSLGSGAAWINEQSILMDPFAWITVLSGVLGGDAMIKYGLTVSVLLKLYAAGFLCLRYLRNFPFRSLGRAVASWLFAFSGYMLLWGQHFFLGTAPLFLLLVLTAAERVLRDDSPKHLLLLGLSCTATMLYSTYLGYMILLFSALYFLLRLSFATQGAAKGTYGKKLFRAIPAVLLGFLGGAVLFLPSAEAILATSRLSSEESLAERLSSYLSLYDPRVYLSVLSRSLSSSLLGNAGWPSEIAPDNYYEMPQLFFSGYLYLILGQWFSLKLLREPDKRTARKRLLCLILCLAVLLLPFGAGLFNAFAQNTFRFTYLLLPLLALMTAEVWEALFFRKEGSYAALLIGTALSLAVIFFSRRSMQEKLYPLALWLARLAVLPALYETFRRLLKLGGRLFRSRAAAFGLRAAEFFAAPLLLAALLAGVLTEGEVTVRWRNHMGPEEMSAYEAAEKESREVIASLQAEDPEAYRIEKTYMDFFYGDSMAEGYMPAGGYNSVITGGMREFYRKYWPGAFISEKLQLFTEDPDPQLAAFLGVRYILSREEKVPDGYTLLRTEKGISVYKNSEASPARVYGGEVLPGQSSVPCRDLILEKNVLTGTAESESGGTLLLTLPYEPGWKLTVDGEETETFRVLDGLIGAELAPGSHSFRLVYADSLYFVGLAVSVLSLAGLFAVTIHFRRGKKAYDQL